MLGTKEPARAMAAPTLPETPPWSMRTPMSWGMLVMRPENMRTRDPAA